MGIKKLTNNQIKVLHTILRRENKKSNVCFFCKTTTAKAFEFALIKGREYSSNREDYYELCVSCHKKYDMTDERRKQCSDRMSKLSRGDHPSSRAICKLSLDGGIIKYYDSIVSVKDDGYEPTPISNYLSGRSKTSYGFKWEYND
jgi:hypothetical protein